PEQGTVCLTAMHRSGRIVIEVADDGGGIDRRKLRDIAMRNRLIAADAQLSEEEIDNLIFLPGFSTAATLSNVSGRGVGMDVVRKAVQALGGRISITSRPRVGSAFTLILPLTLRCHLVIADFNMPRIDGLELLRVMRSNRTTRDTPF